MSHPITIRRAAAADLDAIHRIEQVCFVDEAFPRRVLNYLVTKAQGATIVATCGDQTAGYISLLIRSNTRNVRIYSVAVSPNFRGRGIAAQLVEESIRFAHEQHRTAVTLEVRHDNHAAIALYEKFGFRRTERLKEYYHAGTDGWRMVLNLSRDC